MDDVKVNSIMAGMDEAYKAEEDRLNRVAPKCHFRPMFLDSADASDYHTAYWWECSVCGHTKDA